MLESLKRLAPVPFAVVLAVLLALFLAPHAPAGTAPPERAGCPFRNAEPGDTSAQNLRASIRCLLAAERRQAHKGALQPNSQIGGVGARHASVMRAQDCLGHQCPGESTLKTRMANSGYPYPSGSYKYGEITGCSLTPATMVEAWMKSSYHRGQILTAAYRDIGVGLVTGRLERKTCDDGTHEIWSVILAWRKH